MLGHTNNHRQVTFDKPRLVPQVRVRSLDANLGLHSSLYPQGTALRDLRAIFASFAVKGLSLGGKALQIRNEVTTNIVGEVGNIPQSLGQTRRDYGFCLADKYGGLLLSTTSLFIETACLGRSSTTNWKMSGRA